MKVVLDPGHGGKDPGAVGAAGTKEKDVVLPVAVATAFLLRAMGHDVRLTRTDDTFVELGERAGIANRWNAGLFVSIHANAFPHPSVSGIETFHYPGSAKGERLARLVQDKLLAVLRLPNRGVKTARFVVLKQTQMPAILVELGFLTHPEEEQLLSHPLFPFAAAHALAEGIQDGLQALLVPFDR